MTSRGGNYNGEKEETEKDHEDEAFLKRRMDKGKGIMNEEEEGDEKGTDGLGFKEEMKRMAKKYELISHWCSHQNQKGLDNSAELIALKQRPEEMMPMLPLALKVMIKNLGGTGGELVIKQLIDSDELNEPKNILIMGLKRTLIFRLMSPPEEELLFQQEDGQDTLEVVLIDPSLNISKLPMVFTGNGTYVIKGQWNQLLLTAMNDPKHFLLYMWSFVEPTCSSKLGIAFTKVLLEQAAAGMPPSRDELIERWYQEVKLDVTGKLLGGGRDEPKEQELKSLIFAQFGVTKVDFLEKKLLKPGVDLLPTSNCLLLGLIKMSFRVLSQAEEAIVFSGKSILEVWLVDPSLKVTLVPLVQQTKGGKCLLKANWGDLLLEKKAVAVGDIDDHGTDGTLIPDHPFWLQIWSFKTQSMMGFAVLKV